MELWPRAEIFPRKRMSTLDKIGCGVSLMPKECHAGPGESVMTETEQQSRKSTHSEGPFCIPGAAQKCWDNQGISFP